MNYILFNYGNTPDYIKYTLNSIKSVDPDSEIYFLSNRKNNFKNLNNLYFSDFPALNEKKDFLIDYYDNTPYSKEKYPLFFTSALRIYALHEISNRLKIDSFIHFDNDVLIYKSFKELNRNKLFVKDKINITQSNFNDLLFGSSYFPTNILTKKLIEEFDSLLKNIDSLTKHYGKGSPLHEMRMLNIIKEKNDDMFNILPSLPYSSDINIIFDPASYGQFFNGMHHRRGNYIFKRRWVNTKDIVGREIKSKRIVPKFSNNLPSVQFKNKNVSLTNLHIHSKNLDKFLPNNYYEHC